MNLFFIVFIILNILSNMVQGQDKNSFFDGTYYYSFIGKDIGIDEDIREVYTDSIDYYPKSILFNYRLNIKSKEKIIGLYGGEVNEILIYAKNQKICAVNFFLSGGESYLDNVINSIGYYSSGSGVGVGGDAPTGGSFFWKLSDYCLFLSFGKYLAKERVLGNFIVTLFDCNIASVLPNYLTNLPDDAR